MQEPLRAVTGFGELLAKNIEETDNEKAKDHLRRIIAASKRMQTLIVPNQEQPGYETGNPLLHG
ncbi:MAG: hypothetical protein C0469_18125 [Cyanobacteria bacterium DS2.3.42]|nr:hypothetical protein [Cyanobacteria bacterium DS2.3.42]